MQKALVEKEEEYSPVLEWPDESVQLQDVAFCPVHQWLKDQ
jgi:hypothetical protein